MEMANDDVSDPTAVSIAYRFDRKGTLWWHDSNYLWSDAHLLRY